LLYHRLTLIKFYNIIANDFIGVYIYKFKFNFASWIINSASDAETDSTVNLLASE